MDPHDEQQILDCNLCGASPCGSGFVMGRWRIRFCARCGLGRTDPQEIAGEPGELYDEEFFIRHSQQSASGKAQIRRAVRKLRRRVRLVRRFKPSGRLLEVGCASGFFLEAARQAGFEVRGVEISSWAADRARALFGHRVEAVPIEAFSPGDEKFDVIAAWHVLEHLRDPLGCLKNMREWLRPEGVLVLEMPNSESVDARMLGADWADWGPQYHFWHFSPRSLTAMLRAAGFEPIFIGCGSSGYVKNCAKSGEMGGRAHLVVRALRSPLAKLFPGFRMNVVARLL